MTANLAARRRVAVLVLGSAAAVVLGAGGSSSGTSSGSSSAGAAPAAATPTVATADVPGVGTVLVNGSGQTLYVLSTEAGGKVTCTDANGCTKYWPDTELPHGVSHANAGTGARSSLLGTTKGADGDLYVTYSGYPLYTFSGDGGPGVAKGQGVKSFGGVWEAMAPSGTPVMAAAHSTTPTSAPASGGYGY